MLPYPSQPFVVVVHKLNEIIHKTTTRNVLQPTTNMSRPICDNNRTRAGRYRLTERTVYTTITTSPSIPVTTACHPTQRRNRKRPNIVWMFAAPTLTKCCQLVVMRYLSFSRSLPITCCSFSASILSCSVFSLRSATRRSCCAFQSTSPSLDCVNTHRPQSLSSMPRKTKQ